MAKVAAQRTGCLRPPDQDHLTYEERMPEMEREAWELAARLSSRDCDDCHGGGMAETAAELNIEVPEGMRHVVSEHAAVSAKVICPCVVRTMDGSIPVGVRIVR